MAEFSGKIIEAYFSNSEKDTICIMWNNDAGEKETLEEFYCKTDPDNHYFKALLKEIPLEEIEEHTQKRAVVYMEELKRIELECFNSLGRSQACARVSGGACQVYQFGERG